MAPIASPMRRDASIQPSDASDQPNASQDARFRWTSREGLALILKILLEWPVPFHPHDYLLLWTAHVLEGSHFFGITATGDGKSCMFYYALIVMIYYAKNGLSPCGRTWSKNPAAVIVLPVTAIEDDLGPRLNALGLPTVVINSKTLATGAQRIWDLARRELTCIIILSPEILVSRRFNSLLESGFGLRTALLGIDEVHLLLTWGIAFRKAFSQIGLLRARLGSLVQLICLTASLLPGQQVHDVCASLGLRTSDVHFERRCNLRGNLVLQRHAMLSALDGPEFPQLRWMVAHRLKAVVFARTIAQTWRICSYLWSCLPPGDSRALGVRPYNALNPDSYNLETRRLLEEHNGGVFVATTSALSVGVDIPKVHVVAIWGNPGDVNSVIQEPGRAGRGERHHTALGLIYVTQALLSKAIEIADSGQSTDDLSYPLARVLAVEHPEAVLKELYQSPELEDCSCPTCDGTPISGRWEELEDGPAILALAAEQRRAAAASTGVKQKKRRLPPTKAMRALILARLIRWRDAEWLALPYESTLHDPPCFIIADHELEELAAGIFDYDTIDKVRAFLEQHKCSLLVSRAGSLLKELEGCRKDAVALRQEKKAAAQAKRAATLAATRAAAAAADTVTQKNKRPGRKENVQGQKQARKGAQVSGEGAEVGEIPPENFYGQTDPARVPLQELAGASTERAPGKRKLVTSGMENAQPSKRTRTQPHRAARTK